MPETGIITTFESGVDVVVEWKIDYFTLLESDAAYSPFFSFGGEEWSLWIYPNGSSGSDSSGHVDLCLFKWGSSPSIKQSLSLALKTVRGEKCNEQHCTKVFDDDNFFHRFIRFIPRSELNRRRSDLTPDDTLTVICTMKNLASAGSDSSPMWFWQFFKWNSKETTIAAEKSLEENSKNACVEAWTQTEEENGYNCREKLLMVLCIASILTAVVTGCILAYSKTSLSSTHPCGEAVKKIQTLERNKANNRSDVVPSNEFEASSSNEANATDIKKWEPLPQPVLIVTEVGSTYLEVVWVLSEESKTNASHIHYIVLFRKYGAQWQEVTFPDATRTSYSLTNLDRGMSYQIYVMAVDSSGFSRRSDIATVRTSNKVIYHNSPKGHEKQFVLYATAIILVVIVIACVYGYSKTSLSATQPYEENMGAAHSRKKMSSIKEGIKKNSEVEKGRFTPNIQFGFHSSSINENEVDIDIAKESKERGNINIQKDSVQIKNPERNIFDHKLKSLKKKYQNRRENRELKDKCSIEECCEEEDYSSKFHSFATDEYYPSSLNPFAPEEDYPCEINPFESENSVNSLENNSDDEQNENSSNDNLLLINDKEINNSIAPID